MNYPAFCLQFVPMGPHLLEGRHKPPPANHKDPERTPSRELARDLGQYGANLLESRIKVEFTRQVGGARGGSPTDRPGWKAHIKNLVDSYELALKNYDAVIGKNKEWAAQQAELMAFCFSLVAIPVIRWAGAFVEHGVSPSFVKIKRTKTTSITVRDAQGLMDIKDTVNFTSERTVNELLAQAFSGITEDILGGIVEKLKADGRTNAAEPFAGIHPGNSTSVVTAIRNQLDGALEAGAGVVLDRIDDALAWMKTEHEFGDAWARMAGGNKTLAMSKIVQHFTALRDRWAKSSLYFGQDPVPLPPTIARQFERMLWAAYIDGLCGQVLKEHNVKRETIYAPDWPVGKNDHTNPKVGWTGEAGRRVMLMNQILDEVNLGPPIVDQLKVLNVVFAETKEERDAQSEWRTEEGKWNKQDDKGPDLNQEKPTLDVKGSVDRLNELRALWNWALKHPKDCSKDVLLLGREQGIPRPLRSLSLPP